MEFKVTVDNNKQDEEGKEDEGAEGVNINENNDAQKDELSTGSASPSSSNSLDVPEVQTTTTSSLIKSKATIPRSKDARNRLSTHSLLLSRQHSNDSPHDDLERNIPVTLIDHETGLKRSHENDNRNL
ncbi:CLUMA_CG017741, isoform A [Clunio marinus]|uniref:CLUMA_CG017741, isoform A n=1 Tax=Clunio marinus TaxID=568069 RepID=A0A1J1IWT8_9DIPT|nr:CLUMA_CG017741, isoform A [Clunio marinus]